MKLPLLLASVALLCACGKPAPQPAQPAAPAQPAPAAAVAAPVAAEQLPQSTSVYERERVAGAVESYEAALLALLQVLPSNPIPTRVETPVTDEERAAYDALIAAEVALEKALGKDAATLPNAVAEIHRKTLEDLRALTTFRANIERLEKDRVARS